MKPLSVGRLNFSVAAIRALSAEQRSVLLFLGVMLNEANWLRKLLVKAVHGLTETPDGRANFGLTVTLATTLAGKIYEGNRRMKERPFPTVLSTVNPPEDWQTKKAELETLCGKKGTLISKIRHNLGFHYQGRSLDFGSLDNHIDDTDMVMYSAKEGYGGDFYSHISTLACVGALVEFHPQENWMDALTPIWEEVTSATGIYCDLLAEAFCRMALQFLPAPTYEEVVIQDAPDADEGPIRFFAHPPADLKEMKAAVLGGN